MRPWLVSLRIGTRELDSYLIGITADILRFKDEAGEGYLLDKILDAAGRRYR